MTNIHKTISYIYNPDNQSKEQLIDNFVVRIDLFKRLFNEIKTTKNNFPEQHYIIEGKRGMGKTTMLLRLNYEIENDSDLNTWLIPLVFNEEEYSINTLFKFWERIAALLEEYDTSFRGLSKEMDALYEKKQKHDTYEEEIFKLLIQYLRNHGKKIILFIDNFGDIFNKFKPREVQRLREVLQSNNDIGIVAGSSIILDAFHDVKHPFYEFFKIQRLRGLDRKEAEALLLKLGEIYNEENIKYILQNHGGKVEALRRLTGGVVRTVVLLFEIFTDDKNGDTFKDLEALLDRVTPLYKHRMDELPSAQQEIVEALALGWDGMTAKEIAQKTREESKVISAQLSQLVKNEVVYKISTNTKNHIYQIDERFFNIWYLMRHGKKGDINKVKWLIRFLEEWCEEKDLIQKTKRLITSLKTGIYDKNAALYWIQSLSKSKLMPSGIQEELIVAGREFFGKNDESYLKYLSETDHEVFENAECEFDERNFEEALSLYFSLNQKPYWNIAECYKQLDDIEEAIKYYNLAFDNGHYEALISLADYYIDNEKDFKKAEKVYLKILQKDKINSEATSGLFDIYFTSARSSKLALKYATIEVSSHKLSPFNWFNYIFALLWNSKYELAYKNIKDFLKIIDTFQLKEVNEAILSLVETLFLLLLSRKKFDYLYNLFIEDTELLQLKDRFKPIWYALMYFMRDKYPNEYLKMGEELRETVEEILAQVAQMAIDYAMPEEDNFL